MINSDSRIVATPDQVSSNLGDEIVILNLRDGTYYGLDAVGARIWSLLQEPRTVAELRDAIVEVYEVDPAQCEGDLLVLLQEMAGRGLINAENDGSS